MLPTSLLPAYVMTKIYPSDLEEKQELVGTTCCTIPFDAIGTAALEGPRNVTMRFLLSQVQFGRSSRGTPAPLTPRNKCLDRRHILVILPVPRISRSKMIVGTTVTPVVFDQPGVFGIVRRPLASFTVGMGLP